MKAFIGVDTSCYTTSVACVNENGIVCDYRTVLSVKPGERGLRQSDGLFQHIKNLEKLVPELFQTVSGLSVSAVGVSTSPRSNEDSYMPVFLAGKTAAASVAAALSVPLIPVSHQDGHVRAALHGNEMLMGEPFIGMHISGGTTETFLVDELLRITLLGGGDDLHAGQFVDRVGVALGLPFPCGKHLEVLAAKADPDACAKLPAIVKEGICSFSGVETKAQQLIKEGMPGPEIAYGVYDCLARTFAKMILHETEKTGVKRVLIAGGVASSPLLRKLLAQRLRKHGEAEVFFGESALSSDNAVGVALRCRDIVTAREQEQAACKTDMY